MYTDIVEINLEKSIAWDKTFFEKYSPTTCFVILYKDISIKIYNTAGYDYLDEAVLHGVVDKNIYLPMTCIKTSDNSWKAFATDDLQMSMYSFISEFIDNLNEYVI